MAYLVYLLSLPLWIFTPLPPTQGSCSMEGGDTPKTKARTALFVVLWEDDVDGFSELLAHCRSQVNYKTHEPVYDH